MVTTNQIYWLAGFLDGEGSFQNANTPLISINQTDLDLVERVKQITNCSNSIGITEANGNRKTLYYFTITGMSAIQWMMTIYPIMSVRRKSQIREIIATWKQRKRTQKGVDYCSKGHSLLEAENCYLRENGRKICKICHNERTKEYKTNTKGKMIRMIMVARNVSKEEAEKIYNDTVRVN